MKSSPPEQITESSEKIMPSSSSFRLFSRLSRFLKQFRHDLRVEIPESKGKPLGQRIRARAIFLYRRYGWKLVAGLVAYYLVRDTLLYIILPYLIASRLID